MHAILRHIFLVPAGTSLKPKHVNYEVMNEPIFDCFGHNLSFVWPRPNETKSQVDTGVFNLRLLATSFGKDLHGFATICDDLRSL